MTLPLGIAAASLAFVLSPSLGLANTPARTLANQTQVLRQPVRQSVYFHTPAAKTENHGRSIEQVIKDQREWYQMID
jgi:hypothetical protein